MRYLLAAVALTATSTTSIAQARIVAVSAPTLSEYGLGALVVGVAALGAWIARRKK